MRSEPGARTRCTTRLKRCSSSGVDVIVVDRGAQELARAWSARFEPQRLAAATQRQRDGRRAVRDTNDDGLPSALLEEMLDGVGQRARLPQAAELLLKIREALDERSARLSGPRSVRPTNAVKCALARAIGCSAPGVSVIWIPSSERSGTCASPLLVARNLAQGTKADARCRWSLQIALACGERVARLDAAGFEAALEPAHALLGAAVRERFRRDVAARLLAAGGRRRSRWRRSDLLRCRPLRAAAASGRRCAPRCRRSNRPAVPDARTARSPLLRSRAGAPPCCARRCRAASARDARLRARRRTPARSRRARRTRLCRSW